MSNEKRVPGWLGYIGDEILPEPTDSQILSLSLSHHLSSDQLGNEKTAPDWLGYLLGIILPSYIADYFINHEVRIPSLTNQDSMESKGILRGSLGDLFKIDIFSAVVLINEGHGSWVFHIFVKQKKDMHHLDLFFVW